MAFLLKFSFFFLATIETVSNKKEKILLVTHNQECKKKKKKWRIYAFFSKHETCLYILATISYNFQFVNIYICSMIKSLYYYFFIKKKKPILFLVYSYFVYI